MSHSRMLASRRKKQRNKKQLARLEKRAKKLAKINARMGGASTAKNG